MRFLKKFLLWFVIVLTSIILLLYIFNLDYLIRAIRITYMNGETTAFLEDYVEFPNREIKKGTGQPWAISKNYNKAKSTDRLEETRNQ